MLNPLPATSSDGTTVEIIEMPSSSISTTGIDRETVLIVSEDGRDSAVSSPDTDVPVVSFNGHSKGGNRLVTALKEWQQLQKEIQANSATVSKKSRDVEEGLNNYRIVLTGAIFKSQKLDEEIWNTFDQSVGEVPPLSKKTSRVPLFLRSLKHLRELNQDWQEVVNHQDMLLSMLDKAPKSVDFYNRIHLARIKKHEQELRDAEIARRNAQAREVIERALSKIGTPDQEGRISLGSKILRLEDASNYWNQRLVELTNLERNGNVNPDEVIAVLQSLQDTIADAPAMAERVKEVEVQFTRLMSMQEELATYGKSVIPQEDLTRALLTMQDEIPRLWATGNWDKLRRALSEVTSFVKFYEMPVRSELAVTERRKPGVTRSVLAGAASLPFSQATPIIRALVSAIDARDRFMKGHSDTVARLAVMTARRLGWSNEDLEMLELASLLHDVGKILIPENVLTKTDPLSPDEWKTIQTHPYHGARIVKSMEPLNRIVPWVYHHQERWDGNGYPDGLSSNAIPAGARIIAVGEAFTVMTTEQPQRKARSLDEALSEIVKGAGSQFDPEAASAFVETIESSQHSGGAGTAASEAAKS
jgi:putative nucleotidyltransferase with HDIG domain